MTSPLLLSFIDKHPEEVAALVEGQAIPDVRDMFEKLDTSHRTALIPYLSIQYLQDLSSFMNEEVIIELCKRHSSRTLFNVFSVLPAEKRTKFLPRLPKRAQWYLNYAHKNHENYIANLMSSEYLSLDETMTAETAWKAIKATNHRVLMIYTHATDNKRLQGQILLEDLYSAQRTTILRDLATVVKYSQTPFTPISNITQHNIWRHFTLIPIIDHDKRLLGIIQTKAIYEEILKEDHDVEISLYDNIEALIQGFYSVIKTLYYPKNKGD